MQRFLPLLIAILLSGAPVARAQTDGVMERCPTLARLLSAGKLDQIRDPVFTDRQAAARFASDCRKVAEELSRFPALPPEYAELRDRAALAAEFLTGETHVLSTSNIGSVVKLREEVKIPLPAGLVYVRRYASQSSMPPIVQAVFARVKRSDKSHTQGVTITGRYIALIRSEFHGENHDTLSHEMVHAYLHLASSGHLPEWFHEGAAVYFSLGRESKLYNKFEDPAIIKEMRVPEDYKSDLRSLQFIENKIGRAKLYEFVRRAVETGNPDPRAALGLKPPAPEVVEEPSGISRLTLAALIGAGVLAAAVIAWVVWRREDI
ncbi:MAG: hypothetical protein Q7T82_10400 [Armatimonadota bacterium]|nr:hypothetical protein [Armatimonadota bacterium]